MVQNILQMVRNSLVDTGGIKEKINENNFSLDPLLDIEAQKIALNLGLTIRRAEEDKGTSLVILDRFR